MNLKRLKEKGLILSLNNAVLIEKKAITDVLLHLQEMQGVASAKQEMQGAVSAKQEMQGAAAARQAEVAPDHSAPCAQRLPEAGIALGTGRQVRVRHAAASLAGLHGSLRCVCRQHGVPHDSVVA